MTGVGTQAVGEIDHGSRPRVRQRAALGEAGHGVAQPRGTASTPIPPVSSGSPVASCAWHSLRLGHARLGHNLPSSTTRLSNTANPAPAPPRRPVTPTRSPTPGSIAADNSSSESAQPTAVIDTVSAGAATTSPPSDRDPGGARERVGATHQLERLLLVNPGGSPSTR